MLPIPTAETNSPAVLCATDGAFLDLKSSLYRKVSSGFDLGCFAAFSRRSD
jgi:hypothetical protein